MPENNQIQDWLQPEIQTNSQVQQDSFVQNQQSIQQTNQQIIQENKVQPSRQTLQQITENKIQNIYYHPTRLTKILSGIYRFIWIVLIRAGLRNFSLIWTPDLWFLKILYVWWIITLCWIFYILLWKLLYNTKSRIHSWFSLLWALAVNIMFSRILRTFTHNWYLIDKYTLKNVWIIITCFTLLYFWILTIRWIIKCRKFKKKWTINPIYLDSTPSKKKFWFIITITLIFIIIINLIYGKINWSKIPEINESIFYRDYHQTKLSEKEDAIYQLKNYNNWNINHIFMLLDSYYIYELNNKDISRKKYPEECITIYSWWNEYCGTWAWNRDTLKRVLNNYYYIDNSNYYKDFVNDDWYLSIKWKKTTIFEFIKTYEAEIKSELKELDRITSMDYYLPDDKILDLFPQTIQSYNRSSILLMQYYIYQEDWDMVMFIIKLNYKIIDLLNNSWSLINQLNSIIIQWNIDYDINSYIQILPKNFRNDLSERYSTQIYNKQDIIDKMVKWEYITRNQAKTDNILWDIWNNIPSLYQFLFHFPFYSEKDTNKLMNYWYYNFRKWNNKDDIFDKTLYDYSLLYNYSLYNIYWKYPYQILMPRSQSIHDRIDKSLYHKQSLIENLKSGNYNTRFNELDWNSNPSIYEEYLLKEKI